MPELLGRGRQDLMGRQAARLATAASQTSGRSLPASRARRGVDGPPRWAICAIEFGAPTEERLPRPPLSPALSDLPEPPPESMRACVSEAAAALRAGQGAGFAARCASQVRVVMPDGRPRLLAPPDAAELLVTWRTAWQSFELVMSELLLSGSMGAATGSLVGLDADSVPRCIDLSLTCRLQR